MAQSKIPVFDAAGKILHMNDREQFLQTVKSFVARIRDRIQTMTETEVVEALRAQEAFRRTQGEMLAWLKSVSLEATADSQDEIHQLKFELNQYPRLAASSLFESDDIEKALRKRLETLRKRPDNNS